jgi:hypothetical protein
MNKFRNVLALGVLAGLVLPAESLAQATQPCRVLGMRTEVQCGIVKRPLDRKNPAVTIDVHYVVIPALARNKKQDALFFFAGGPGQSALKQLAGYCFYRSARNGENGITRLQV